MLINKLYINLNSFYNKFAIRYGLQNPLYIRNEHSLTWAKRDSAPKDYDYEKQFLWISENMQYSLALSDLGFFQFYYNCNETSLISASVSFYPNPEGNHQYIRFDFDSKASITYSHPYFHMHFGYPSNSMRIGISHYPYPSEFIHYILSLNGFDNFKYKQDRFISKTIEQSYQINSELKFIFN